MKQIITCMIALSAAFAANAEYLTLSFKTSGGESHSIGIQGLEVKFSEETLTAFNPMTTITLPLAQVESMEFTDAASVSTVNGDWMKEQTTVFDLSGRQLGSFRSFSEAMSQLPVGIYLFRYADGTTLKIVKE